MSTRDAVAALLARFESLEAELAATHSLANGEKRERLRNEISTLFQETEGLIGELGEFKQRIHGLVERFESLPVAVPALTRADHLGSSTFLERGWNAIAGGNYDEAVQLSLRAVELAPGDSTAEVQLGWALMLRGDLDDSLAILQRVLAREPDNLLARANLGYICLKKGIIGEAIEHLKVAMRSETDRKAAIYANFYMGLLYLEREMYADSRRFLSRALELGPNLIEAWWELGRACYLDGFPEDAARAWRSGSEANRFSQWASRCGEALARLEADGKASLS